MDMRKNKTMLKRVTRLTQPASEPVSLDEAKSQLRIPPQQTAENSAILGFISAAREQAEQFIDRPICESSFLLVYDKIDSDILDLKYPASTVSEVTYRDQNNEEQAAAFTYDAQLNTIIFNGRIYGTGLKVTIISGQSRDYPQSLKHAILMLIGDLYMGRSSAELVNNAARMMLLPFKENPIL